MLGNAWSVGPFLIKEQWVIYLIALIVSYGVVRAAVKLKSLSPASIDLLGNGFFLFLLIWKGSYTLFHPVIVVNNPISQLYFTGGEKGAVLGLLAVVGYFYAKRKQISFGHMMELGLLALLSAVGTNQALTAIRVLPGTERILEAALAIMLIVYWRLTFNRNNEELLWPKVLLWFSIGEFVISYFKPQMPQMFGLSFSQVFFIALSLGLIFFVKTDVIVHLKKRWPVLLLAGLIGWGAYDFIHDKTVKEENASEQETVGLHLGSVAPDFTLQTLDGQSARLSDYRGKNVMVNFWASWCPPCRAEMPDMQRYYAKHKQDDFTILAVNMTATESSVKDVAKFADEFTIEFPVLLDEKHKVTETYRVVAYPTTYFIDKNGVVQNKFIGAMNEEGIRKQVNGLND